MKTEKQIRDAIDKHMDNTDWMANNWGSMTYADGVRAALEWAMEDELADDDDFTGELPD